MSAVARALLGDLSPTELAELAERLRPFLERQPDHPELLTPAEAAARLHLHPKTLTRAARAGRVPGAERVGRSWRFRADELRLEPAGVVASTPTKLGPSRGGKRGAVDAIRGVRS